MNLALKRIMIVEDQRLIAADLERVLRKFGYQVVASVASGEEAIPKVASVRPDLIFMDIRLAGQLDGVQTAQLICAQADIPIVYLTAYADDETILRARGTSAFGYVVKPFNERELRAAVEIAIYKHHTDRLLAQERAHRRSAEEFKLLVSTVYDHAIFMLDHSGRVTTWNDGAQRVKGYTAEEILGKHFSVFYDAEDVRNGRPVADLHAAQSLGHVAREGWRIRKNGSRFWANDVITAIRDEQGVHHGYGCVTRDVTEQKQNEDALRESERRFRGTFQNAPVGIAHVDMDGRWLRVNEALCRITGYSRPELLDKTFGDITHPDDVEADWAQARRLAAGEIDSYSMEVRYIRKGGAITWVHLTTSLYHERSTGRRYFIAVVEDIHARKVAEAERARAEEALRESEARFRALADNVSQLAWMADASGQRFWFNRRWFEYTGSALEEMQGWGWEKAYHPECAQRALEKYRRHMQSGEPWVDTLRIRGHDGEYRWFLSQAMPVRDEAGKVERWFGTNTDITAQREAEEMLVRSVQLRDEFLSVAAHELRTPLTALALQLQSLRRMSGEEGGPAEPSLRKKIEVAIRQGARLGGLVERLLNVSRIGCTRLQLELEFFDLREVLRDAVERVRELAAKADCELRVQVEGPAYGTWDKSRLDQVLMNLLSNALKYGHGGPVDIRLSTSNEGVALAVRDYGLGIALADQQRIFGRFERAASVNNYGGFGLGLYISHEIVLAHGGTIEVQSSPGEGASFTVRLPWSASVQLSDGNDSGEQNRVHETWAYAGPKHRA